VITVRTNRTVLARQVKGRSTADVLPPGATAPGDGEQRAALSTLRSYATASVKAPGAADQLISRLAGLPSLTLAELRLEWRRFYRTEPPGLSRDILMRAIAHRLQERVHGGLSRITQRRLTTLERELETAGGIAPAPGPKIKPGSRLIREWHGRTHTIAVTSDGFEFEGKSYRSLTKIAHQITGAQWSGPRFFGLTKRPMAGGSDGVSNGGEAISETTNG
jgi:Protein of unknown function (DUF2924)